MKAKIYESAWKERLGVISKRLLSSNRKMKAKILQ